MLKAIKNLLSTPEENETTYTPQQAAGVLMLEIMAADEDISAIEKDTLSGILQTSLNVSPAEANRLIIEAQQQRQQAADLYQFTSVINRFYNNGEKQRLLEHLWTLAFADGKLDKYEEYSIRKLAGLLHMPHSAFIKAKQKAR